MYEIESGIPLPKRTRSSGRPWKYPFDKMGVGDSFYVHEGKSARLAGAATRYVKHHDGEAKFMARSVDGGARIWRVS